MSDITVTPTHKFLNHASEHMATKYPEQWAVAYPRRIVTPPGYPNPRYAGMVRFSHLTFGAMPDDKVNKTMRDCMVVSWRMVEFDCPTFFATQNLLEDLVETDPPKDMTLSELKWPFDAMMFVLPDKFAHSYFPRPVPFISVARMMENRIMPCDKLLSQFPNQPKGIGYPPTAGKGAFFMNACAMFRDYPYDYALSYPMGESIATVLTDDDFSANEDVLNSVIPLEQQTTPKEDLELLHRAAAVATWLMLCMMARPIYVDQGPVLQRPAKFKNGALVKEALWRPDFIGRAYVRSVPQGGHHASPRLHRRRGHMRMQPHGPKNSERKLIWIEHTWVGA